MTTEVGHWDIVVDAARRVSVDRCDRSPAGRSKAVAEPRRQQQAGNAAADDHDSYNLSHENIQRVMN
jgi:hypothetical protein